MTASLSMRASIAGMSRQICARRRRAGRGYVTFEFINAVPTASYRARHLLDRDREERGDAGSIAEDRQFFHDPLDVAVTRNRCATSPCAFAIAAKVIEELNEL
jgi:hypothetical protein